MTRRRERIIVRLTDNTWWAASHPGHPWFFGFWFRRVEAVRVLGLWWAWQETGETWAIPHPEPFPKNAILLNAGDPVSVNRARRCIAEYEGAA